MEPSISTLDSFGIAGIVLNQSCQYRDGALHLVALSPWRAEGRRSWGVESLDEECHITACDRRVLCLMLRGRLPTADLQHIKKHLVVDGGRIHGLEPSRINVEIDPTLEAHGATDFPTATGAEYF